MKAGLVQQNTIFVFFVIFCLKSSPKTQPNLPTEGNEAKEELVFQRNANSNFVFLAAFCGESLFTKGNQGNESFCSRARTESLFSSLSSV